ncbi:helix-turn-helix domain-containing protein [Hoeflea alexandrii]|uniref:helix-turn-helix domain-containing protein n=1 Tax=Hoeflea alexandrii TaxID=288436 RepID=UPI0022AF9109|nr:helix-turn-helix domain-containing protein [Hoeflea alexandrii]
MENVENNSARAADKWKEASLAGFQILPDVLLKKQADLGLSALDMLVLINILQFWWYRDKRPFPRATTLARRMGVTTRTIQRSLQTLTNRGLLRREKVTGDGKEKVEYDLEGLVERLRAYAIKDLDYLARIGMREVGDAARPLSN